MIRAGRDVGSYTERCRIAEDSYDIALALERRRDYLLRERDVMSRVTEWQENAGLIEEPAWPARLVQWVRGVWAR
jgi:hypothetical protein